MKMWEEAGAAKAAAAAMEYVTDLTDQGRKVVVFYHHTQTLMSLLKPWRGSIELHRHQRRRHRRRSQQAIA